MASGFTTLTNQYLIETDVWERQIQSLLIDDLYGIKWVRMLDGIRGSTTYNLPSLGEAEQSDFVEGMAVKYVKMDEGNFQFSVDQYKYSANSISEKYKRDSIYAQDVISAFVPRQHRVLMQGVETRIFNRMNAMQTASDPNTINGAAHRWVGHGTSDTLNATDFRLANYGLRKALVPMRNLVCCMSPEAAYQIEGQANMVNLMTPAPQWQDVYHSGIVTGYQFKFNIFGFDCYVSNYLPDGISETVVGPGGSNAVTNGVATYFFSAEPGDTLPVVGAFTQMPTVYQEFNKDLQQWEFVTFAEYGFKGYRPENLITVLIDKTAVS